MAIDRLTSLLYVKDHCDFSTGGLSMTEVSFTAVSRGEEVVALGIIGTTGERERVAGRGGVNRASDKFLGGKRNCG